MYVLVSYDIVDNKTRTRVMKLLKNFGERIQQSVFECELDEAHYRRMKKGVERLIDSELDSVRYYRLCRVCMSRVVVSGWGEVQEEEGFEII